MPSEWLHSSPCASPKLDSIGTPGQTFTSLFIFCNTTALRRARHKGESRLYPVVVSTGAMPISAR
jgi:hypothetical protein